jgi:glycosyltransferase involved in cell wall biosynthesis
MPGALGYGDDTNTAGPTVFKEDDVRVGIIAPPWVSVPPEAYGGTEEFIDELARGLDRRGHDVVMFTTGDSTCPVTRRWTREASCADLIGDAHVEQEHVMQAYEALSDVDIVHDNTMAGPLYALEMPDVPVVTTHHGPFDTGARELFGATAGRVALVAISHHQASTAGDVPISAVIHHGLQPERYPVGSGEGGYFLFLGRMTPDKGAHQAALLAQETGVTLLLAGKRREPAEQAYFEEQVAPLLGRDIEYLGEVTNDRKVALMQDATALVNPIQWPEPFGLVMIEALACGTPVLASPAGAAPEIVGDGITGFLCDDLSVMADRLVDVDKLDRAACRRAVEQEFATDRMFEEYERLFHRILADRATAAVASSGGA